MTIRKSAPKSPANQAAGRKESRGRQFSRREVTIHDDGTELVSIAFPRVSLRTLTRLKNEALNCLNEAGIDTTLYLLSEGHGSNLRWNVINYLDNEADSILGLASRIYEQACHVEAYEKLQATEQAIDGMSTLSELVKLWDIYRTQTNSTKKSAQAKRPKRVDSMGVKVEAIFRAAIRDSEGSLLKILGNWTHAERQNLSCRYDKAKDKYIITDESSDTKEYTERGMREIFTKTKKKFRVNGARP